MSRYTWGGMMGRWLLLAGLLLILVGAIVQWAPWLVSWFGKLPGDIHIETRHSRVFIPVTSMIVMSVILTLVINLLRR